jgi:gamma-glutamyltranspeptidase
MVATSHPLATQAALGLLQSGGNAIDAAIAANAMLGLMEPTGCGIGGDLFAIVWDAETKELYGLNASGRSPKSLTIDYFTDRGLKSIPPLGPIPVTIPGCVDGWFELHDRFGSLDFQTILQPAINYGNNGFPVTEIIILKKIAKTWDISLALRKHICPMVRHRLKGKYFQIPVWPLHTRKLLKMAAIFSTRDQSPRQ